jgi:hypothetical protein
MLPTILVGRFDISKFRARLDMMVRDDCITPQQREDYINQVAKALTTPARTQARVSNTIDAAKARIRKAFKP